MQSSILETIQNISSIPTLPSVIERLTRLLQNPKTSAEEVGKAITTDQTLASKVLRLVNSAFYGFPGRISTITHAIVILGFSTVKNVVLTTSILDAFGNKGKTVDGFDLDKYWLHSIACGAAALSIAKQIGTIDKEECFIAGLIHDIGKLIFCQYLPVEFENTLKHSVANKQMLFKSEHALHNCTHQEIGGFLAEKWNLPLSLQNAVKYHHNPSPAHEHFLLTSIVHSADILVRAMDFGNGGDPYIPSISDKAWKSIGFDGLNFHSLLENISEEVGKASIFIQMI